LRIRSVQPRPKKKSPATLAGVTGQIWAAILIDIHTDPDFPRA